MDYDHSPNCESRLFGTKCTCDAPERARIERENDELLEANDGVMPLASERARAQKEKEVAQPAVEDASPIDAAVTAALKKLTDQGLTHDEAVKVLVRRINA